MNKFAFDEMRTKKNDTTKDIAEFLGVSIVSIYNKKNESGTQFSKKEIEKLAKRWKLTPEELQKIFFA